MLLQIPSYGRLVETYDDFVKCSTDIAHFAVYRKTKYWHHFIVANFCGKQKKRIQYDVTLNNFFTGPGQVIEDDLSSCEDIKEIIKKKKSVHYRGTKLSNNEGRNGASGKEMAGKIERTKL